MDDHRTVLIIDDAPIFRELATSFLARCGRVLTAENGGQGLAMAKIERPDVVLVDLRLPDMDGEEVCRSIRRNPSLAHCSVLVMLGSGNPEARARCLRAGAADVIYKPLSRVALIDSVSRFLNAVVVRGQPRVGVSIPVEIHAGEDALAATARNVSRGGIYLETPHSFAPRTELDLQFELPDTKTPLEATAEVVWRKVAEGSGRPVGMGMRFLAIDSDAARLLDDYVFERAVERRPIAAGASA